MISKIDTYGENPADNIKRWCTVMIYVSNFSTMNAAVRTSVLFCLFHAKVFGQEQFHGFFKFIGYRNSPEMSFVNHQSYNKSKRECSSHCLKEENCYFFDICKNGGFSSCYFYDNNVFNSPGADNGVCRRFELVI